MTERHDRAQELLAAYSLDALEPDEQALVLEHLAEGCEECSEEEAALRATSLLLALGAPASDGDVAAFQPPASLRDRILSETQTPTPISAHRGWRWNPLQALRGPSITSPSIAASVAGFAVAGLLAWAIVLQIRVDDLQGDNDALASAMTMAQVSAEEATSSAIAAVFASTGDSRVVNLSSPSGAAALGRMIQDDDSGHFTLVVDGLSQTEGGGYVFWAGTEKIAELYVDETGTGISSGYLDTDGAERLTVTHEEAPEEAESPSRTVLLVNR